MLNASQRMFDHQMRSTPLRRRSFLALMSLLFATSVVLTLTCCRRMASMDNMSMPGGWIMSMMWMRMPSQTWLGAASAFIGMWMPMMVAMMMPVLVPALSKYRAAFRTAPQRAIELSTAALAVGYFLIWFISGLAVFVLGVGLATLVMQVDTLALATPFLAAITIAVAGLIQLSTWKAEQLRCCHHTLREDASHAVASAWRSGLRLGLRCVRCCAPLTIILMVIGMMDIRAMIVVTIATALERSQRFGLRIAHLTGFAAIAMGTWLASQTIR